MRPTLSSRSESSVRTRGCTHLERHVPAYREYLLGRGNAAGYVRSCEAAVTGTFDVDAPDQPGVWPTSMRRSWSSSLKGHLPQCNCKTSARHPACVRAALAHLLVVLREAGVIRPKPQDETAVGEELRRYDQYMTQVRGLAPKTREGALRLVGALLRKHFGDGDIQFDVLTAEHVRHFFGLQAKNYSTPSSLGAVVASLRGYFRWRASLGDRTHALVGALAYPGELAVGIVAQVAGAGRGRRTRGRPWPERPVDAARRRDSALRA